MARTVRPTRSRSGVAVALAAAVVLASGIVGPRSTPVVGIAEVSAQQRSVVVVSDSILTGAQGPLDAQLRRLGWSVTFDGEVSRSTIAGASAVSRHAGGLTDSLLVSLGANDSGNPGTFARRVDAVLAAAGTVPDVYWLTIREVRPYYRPANQVLRDAAARHPNLHLIDWNAASAGRTDLTVGDGLHLSGTGSTALASLVVSSLTGSVAPAPAVTAPTVAAPATTGEPHPAVPDPAAQPAPNAAGGATLAGDAAGGATAGVQFERSLLSAPFAPTPRNPLGAPEPKKVTQRPATQSAVTQRAVTQRPVTQVGFGTSSVPPVVALAVAAALLAVVWTVRRVRKLPVLPVISGPVLHSAITRSELRRARIAEARTRHPAACPAPPPVPDESDLVGARS